MKRLVLGALLAAGSALATRLPAQDLFEPNTVRSFYLTFKDANYWTLLAQNKSAGRDIKADLKVDNVVLKDIGVRFKGNTSYSYNPNSDKKPFNLRFDSFIADQKLYGYEHVNLQNGYKDATFLREPLAYEVMRRYFPSLKCCWIKLYLNGNYWGIYVMVQQLNVRFLRENYAFERGNLYRGDSVTRRTRPVFRYWGTSISSYSSRYDYKTVGHPVPWQDLIKFCDVLNNTSLANLPTVLPRYLDVDQALWYIALNNIFVNTDSYLGTGNDYFAYSDELHGRFQILSWDLNTTFGGYDWARLLGSNRHLMSPYYNGGSRYYRPLIERLLAVPQFKNRYIAHFRTMLDEFFDWKKLGSLATKYHTMLDPSVKTDPKKLYSNQAFTDNLTKDVIVSDRYGSYVIPGLKSFVDKRRAYLLNHVDIRKVAPTVTDIARSIAAPKLTDTVWVTARISGQAATKVQLYSRILGAWTKALMYDDGAHHDGAANDGVFGAVITRKKSGGLVQYYVSAHAASGAIQFLPRHAGVGPESYRLMPTPFSSPIRINEVLADNDSVDQDQAGDYEDWVEVHNTTNAAIDISGYYLTDQFDDPKKYRFPANSVIPAGGFLRIWCDEEPNEGPDHANFKLTKGGEQVALYGTDASGLPMKDALVFPNQKSDRSYGFVPDGGREAYYVYTPRGGRALTGTGIGAATRYDKRRGGSPLDFDLKVVGIAQVGKTFSFEFSGGTPNGVAILGLSAAPAALNLGALGILNIDPGPMLTLGISLDGTGARSFPNTVPAGAVGAVLYAQAVSQDLSNAVLVRFSN